MMSLLEVVADDLVELAELAREPVGDAFVQLPRVDLASASYAGRG